MRSSRSHATLVATAVVFAVGASVMTAGTATAAPSKNPAVSSKTVAPLAVVNLGLSATEARLVQGWLVRSGGYNGAIDGQLGPNSWKAMQRFLRYYDYTGAIDGIVGGGTVSALQSFLKLFGYTGPVDGIAGAGTKAAFKRFAWAQI